MAFNGICFYLDNSCLPRTVAVVVSTRSHSAPYRTSHIWCGHNLQSGPDMQTNYTLHGFQWLDYRIQYFRSIFCWTRLNFLRIPNLDRGQKTPQKKTHGTKKPHSKSDQTRANCRLRRYFKGKVLEGNYLPTHLLFVCRCLVTMG